MKINVLHIVSLLPILLTGCYYSKITLNEQDRSYIPYKDKKHELVFVNENKQYDTIVLYKSKGHPSNLDFYLDKRFGQTKDTKRYYLEAYETNVSKDFDRHRAKAPSEPYVKCNPFIFSFIKDQNDSLVHLYFSIDGRSNGDVYFPKWPIDTLRVGNVLYKDVINFDRLSWSLQYGLIRINEGGGRIWDLVN
jgi:hypothetical protein